MPMFSAMPPGRSILASLVFVSLAGVAGAEDNVVLVELFTSQGCSSCPPADKALAELADRDDVLALSLHVDYWNYLGWQDTFARAELTRRQAEYRDKLGGRVLFTPQIVIDGARSVPGYKRGMISAAIATAAEAPHPASIEIGSDDGMLHARITSQGEHGPSTIWVASYDLAATVDIERGENAGRTFTYRNVVDKLMKVGPWHADRSGALSAAPARRWRGNRRMAAGRPDGPYPRGELLRGVRRQPPIPSCRGKSSATANQGSRSAMNTCVVGRKARGSSRLAA